MSLKGARAFLSAMAKGDGGASHVIGETTRQVVDGLFGKKD
jgi:pyruvate dehydrogenase (quinone)